MTLIREYLKAGGRLGCDACTGGPAGASVGQHHAGGGLWRQRAGQLARPASRRHGADTQHAQAAAAPGHAGPHAVHAWLRWLPGMPYSPPMLTLHEHPHLPSLLAVVLLLNAWAATANIHNFLANQWSAEGQPCFRSTLYGRCNSQF